VDRSGLELALERSPEPLPEEPAPAAPATPAAEGVEGDQANLRPH
jgi:ATP-dependent Lon protease